LVSDETMKNEDHLKNLLESMEVIEESIEKGIAKRQRNIGFNASVAATDMLEMYLHKENLIDPGVIIKHEWFNSENKLKDKFPFEFRNKTKIFALIKEIEQKRNLLCYGKPQKEETLQEVIMALKKLKNEFKEMGLNEI